MGHRIKHANTNSPPPSPLPPPQPYLLHPQARMQWRRCADVPLSMGRTQSVLHKRRVYAGAAIADSDDDQFRVFEYNPDRDGWSALPPCPVKYFGLAVFQGHLITVGGLGHRVYTGKVHHYREESRDWVEYLIPMPTARWQLSIITTESAIIACGGAAKRGTQLEFFTSVEVYTVQTGLWHTADPLPIPCFSMTATTIADTCYLLGGGSNATTPVKTVLCTSISSLVQKATSPPQQSTHQDGSYSLWNTLPDAQLKGSTAAGLSGLLLAIGGYVDRNQISSAIHVFVPPTNSWVRLSGDLPTAVVGATAITLPDNRLLVCGGYGKQKRLTTVYMGSVALIQ